LSGEEIPLGSRILFVADAYGAMTSDRVYRGKLQHESAVAELERCAGAQFDPNVVSWFIEGLERSELVALKRA
jgi:HD-GYP domain-containing protein (c-di-GMP phosphodiesterase class II)